MDSELRAPAVTTLYGLQPYGLHTGTVESLSNYICRLAYAHCVSVRKLISEIVTPATGDSLCYHAVISGNSARGSRAIMGTTDIARRWCDSLSKLTGRHDIRYMTFVPYSNHVGGGAIAIRPAPMDARSSRSLPGTSHLHGGES